MGVNVNTVSCSWVGHQAKRAGPQQPGEGGVQMGRSSSLQGLCPPETTLLLRYQVISLTHFTGGETHRLPHLTASTLWEKEGEGEQVRDG